MPRANSKAKKLTNTSVKNMPFPASGQEFLWDTEIKGFGARATAKTKAFILDRKPNSRTLRVTIGRYPIWSADQARDRAQELVVELNKGNDPREKAKKQKAHGVTLRDGYHLFKKNRTLSARTLYDYDRYMTSEAKPGKAEFFEPWLDLPILEITGDMVAAKYEKLKGSGRGTAQASSAMRTLRSVLTFAINEYGLDMVNPVSTLTRGKKWAKVNKRRGLLRIEEIRPFVRALRQVPNPVLAAYLEFILFTGCRRSEAGKLKWENVSARDLTFTNTKNGEDRTIPISSRVQEILEAMWKIKKGDYVFASEDKEGKATHVTEPRKALARANAGAGTKVTVHDLRRTFSTILEGLDCPMTPLKALLGHSTKQDVTLGHYVVMDVERLRSWSDKYDAHLQHLINTEPSTKVVNFNRRIA
jgi:integrase